MISFITAWPPPYLYSLDNLFILSSRCYDNRSAILCSTKLQIVIRGKNPHRAYEQSSDDFLNFADNPKDVGPNLNPTSTAQLIGNIVVDNELQKQ